MNKFFKRNKIIISIFFFTLFLYFCGFVSLFTSLISLKGIETTIRTIVIMFMIFFLLYLIYYNYTKIMKKKNKSVLFFDIFTIILSIIFLFLGKFIGDIYSSMSDVGESSILNYTSKLINLESDEFTSDSIIGMISNEDDIEGYVLSNAIIKDENLSNEIVYYESYINMLYDLYSGEIDACFMQNNYISLYKSEENFEDLASDTKTIFTFSEKRENNDTVVSTNKTFSEPLTFLIMGVDSTLDGLNDSAVFNGDTLMMITFNPTTNNLTMFSLPRDLMVPISCNNNSIAKINSSAAYGTSCVVNTVQNLTGIDIDYYVKINFKGVVDLVDALGGITVDVAPPDYDKYNGQICEQDSDRQFGSHLICFDSGVQLLDGEQALAYARNRKLYAQSDIDRIAHQQDVVMAIANEAININDYSTFEKILDAVSKNIVTNMSADQILSSYDVLKSLLANAISGKELVSIEKSYLEYYDLRVYMPSYGFETAGLGYYKDSLADIVNMMKVNLELDVEVPIKTFSFTEGEEYKSSVSGSGYKENISYSTLTSFIGMSKSSAQSYCSSKNITCTFEVVDSDSKYYNSSISSGLIGSQSIRDKTLLNIVNSITLYVNGEYISSSTDSPPSLDDTLEDDEIIDEEEKEDENVDDDTSVDDIIPGIPSPPSDDTVEDDEN